MNELPIFLPVLFIVCTLFTLFVLFAASKKSMKVLLISVAWLALQGVLSYKLFYLDTETVPPKFILALFPALVFIVFLLVRPLRSPIPPTSLSKNPLIFQSQFP